MKHYPSLKIALAFLLIAPLFALSVQAHRQWILPSTSVLSGSDLWIGVDAAISNDLFFANHVAMPPESIEVIAPDGALLEKQFVQRGKIRTTFELNLQQQGTYHIRRKGSTLFARWQEGEENKRWRGSLEELKAEGIADKAGVEVFRNSSRIETSVVVGPAKIDAFELESEGLELMPQTHPSDLFVGEPVRWRFFLDGEPVSSLELTFVRGNDRFRNQVEAIRAVTDADGWIEVQFPKAGRYWMEGALRLDATQIEGIAMKRNYTYVRTFEVFPE